MDDPDTKLLVFIVLLGGLAGGFWYFRDAILPPADEPVAVSGDTQVAEEPPSDRPLYPLPPLQPATTRSGKLVPLPPLDDSDSYFLLALVDIFGGDIRRVLVNEALVDNFVATIDNLTRSHVAEKIRPVGRLAEPFMADTINANGLYYLNPDSYARYDLLVSLATRADFQTAVTTYRRFYPLLQQSYTRLGYPDGYFNDRVVEVIDHLLLTPVVEDPIRLRRPHVLYEFADPELEALSSGQKLLLRMGGENAARVKQLLEDFRALIV